MPLIKVLFCLLFCTLSIFGQDPTTNFVGYGVNYDCAKHAATLTVPFRVFAKEDVMSAPPGNPPSKQVVCKSAICKKVVEHMKTVTEISDWRFNLEKPGEIYFKIVPAKHIDATYSMVASALGKAAIEAEVLARGTLLVLTGKSDPCPPKPDPPKAARPKPTPVKKG